MDALCSTAAIPRSPYAVDVSPEGREGSHTAPVLSADSMTPSPRCPGKRTNSGLSLLGICICCGRRDEQSRATPPAVMDNKGLWRCEKLIAPPGWPGRTA